MVCALLILVVPFSALLQGNLVGLEKVLRAPFHIYAAVLFLLGTRRVHWLDMKKSAIAALAGSVVILGLSYIF